MCEVPQITALLENSVSGTCFPSYFLSSLHLRPQGIQVHSHSLYSLHVARESRVGGRRDEAKGRVWTDWIGAVNIEFVHSKGP